MGFFMYAKWMGGGKITLDAEKLKLKQKLENLKNFLKYQITNCCYKYFLLALFSAENLRYYQILFKFQKIFKMI